MTATYNRSSICKLKRSLHEAFRDDLWTETSLSVHGVSNETSSFLLADDSRDSSDDSVFSDVLQALIPKKRNRPSRRVPLKIHVLKSDIRRYYATMLINSFNSPEASLVPVFLRTYSIPDLSFKKKNVDGNGFFLQLQGIDAVEHCFQSNSNTMTDHILRINKADLHRRSDTEDSFLDVQFDLVFTDMSSMKEIIQRSTIVIAIDAQKRISSLLFGALQEKHHCAVIKK